MIRKINMEKNIQTVTFLIGNGFDIGALSALKSEYLTTYSQFYKYLETHCLNKDNLIYKSIFNIKGQVADLWSKDFEEVLHDAFKKNLKVKNKDNLNQWNTTKTVNIQLRKITCEPIVG